MIWNVPAETMPRDELSELQLHRLQETVKMTYQRVPLFRERCDARGVSPEHLRTLSDLRRFPFTVKKDLREHYPFELFARPLREIARIHGSSGTKGKPTVVGYTKSDLETWSELVARSIACAGGRPGDMLHNAYGYGLFTGGLGLHAGAEKFGATVVPVSGGLTKRQITLLCDFRPDGISCTPSYALNLAETMMAMGVDPKSLPLRYGIFGAEPWTEAMRKRIESLLGIDAVDIYGLSEVIGPGVSTECYEEKHGLHIAEDHFYPEIVDPDSGEPLPAGQFGELVFTSLTKEAFPVIRYRTGDLAALIEDPCSCGRTHRKMTRIKGRVDDMMIVRGVNVFPQEIEAELLSVEALAPEYQIVLKRDGALDSMEVHVEWSSEEAAKEDYVESAFVRMIAKRLHERIQVNPKIVIHPPLSLKRSEGKALRVVDERNLHA
jgi:phenylacetate-CoA ligase